MSEAPDTSVWIYYTKGKDDIEVFFNRGELQTFLKTINCNIPYFLYRAKPGEKPERMIFESSKKEVPKESPPHEAPRKQIPTSTRKIKTMTQLLDE